MKTLLNRAQMQLADAHTISKEAIASLDLMERAATAFANAFEKAVPNRNTSISIYCGMGNNGGDGLAIARLLSGAKYGNVRVVILKYREETSIDFESNLRRLSPSPVSVHTIDKGAKLPDESADVLIDALLGTGLNKPLVGVLADWINVLNLLEKRVIAVDVPTGFPISGPIGEDPIVFKADLVISFQQPKQNFMLPESAPYLSRWIAVDIGLDENFISKQDSPYRFLEEKDIFDLLPKRGPFSHKGTFGHALILAGNDETMGAALLAAEACLHSGAGLTTAMIPQSGFTAFNTRLPEVMLFSNAALPGQLHRYKALAIGPGLGNSDLAKALLESFLSDFEGKMVLDADALTMLAEDKSLMKSLPRGTILTPHLKEFDRLFGQHQNWSQRLASLRKEAMERKLVIVLKNRYSIIATPEGLLIFNPTGCPAMSTGGSGDVLTGLIVGFLAQGLSPEQAAMAGTYIHGKTGEDLEVEEDLAVIPASRLAKGLSRTIYRLMQTSL